MTLLLDAFDAWNERVIVLVGAGGKTTAMFSMAHEFAETGRRVIVTTTTRIRMPGCGDVGLMIVSDDLSELLDQARIAFRDHHVIGVACASDHDGKLKGIPSEWVSELAELADHVLVEADGAAMLPFKAPAEYEPVIPLCADLVIAVVGADAVGLALTRENVHRPERIGEITGLRLGEPITPEAIAEVLLHPSGIAKGAPEFARVAALVNKVEDADRLVAARQIGRIVLDGGMERVVIGHVMFDPRVLDVMTLQARGVTA